MISRYILSFYFIVGFCVYAFGQYGLPARPYEKMTFQNFKPKWYYTSFLKTMISDTSDGYNLFSLDFVVRPFELNGYLYSLKNSKCKSDNYCGMLLEKIRLSDGQLMWQYSHDLTNNFRQEVPKLLYLNADNNLELYGTKRIAPYLVGDPGYIQDGSNHMLLDRKVINAETGKLYSQNLADLENDSLQQLVHSDGIRYDFTQIYKVREKINYRNYTFSVKEKKMLYTSFDLDTLGYRISPIDTFYGIAPQSKQNVTQLSDTTFLYMAGTKSAENKFQFNITDKHFNVLSSLYTASVDTVMQPWMLKADKDKILIMNKFLDLNSPETEYLLYKTDGTLLKKAIFNRALYNNQAVPIYWSESNDIYMMQTTAVNSKNYSEGIHVLKANEHGSFDIIKNIIFADTTRTMSPTHVLPYEDDFIITFVAGAWDKVLSLYIGDPHARAVSTMRVTKAELGMEPLATENVDVKKTYQVYPNPSTDFVTIKFNENYQGNLVVLDALGRQVRKIENLNTDFISVDVSMLDSGIYFIQFMSKSSSLANSKFSKY